MGRWQADTVHQAIADPFQTGNIAGGSERPDIFFPAGDGTEADADQVEAIANQYLPAAALQRLKANGVAVLVTSKSVTEAMPQLFVNRQPRGYTAGKRYHDAGGLYYPAGDTIYVAVENHWLEQTVLHEIGHALDAFYPLRASRKIRVCQSLLAGASRDGRLITGQ